MCSLTNSRFPDYNAYYNCGVNPCLNRKGNAGPTGSTGPTGGIGPTGPAGGGGGAQQLPARTLFVSPSWSTAPVVAPFFTDVQPAITFASTLVPAPSVTAPVEIIIFPGTYTTAVTLTSGVYLTGYDDSVALTGGLTWTPTSTLVAEEIDLTRLHITGMTINTTGKGVAVVQATLRVSDSVVGGVVSITSRSSAVYYIADDITFNECTMLPSATDTFTVSASSGATLRGSSVALGKFMISGNLALEGTFIEPTIATATPTQYTVNASGTLFVYNSVIRDITSTGNLVMNDSTCTTITSSSGTYTVIASSTQDWTITGAFGTYNISQSNLGGTAFSVTLTSGFTLFETTVSAATAISNIAGGQVSSCTFESTFTVTNTATITGSNNLFMDNVIVNSSGTLISDQSTFLANLTASGAGTISVNSSAFEGPRAVLSFINVPNGFANNCFINIQSVVVDGNSFVQMNSSTVNNTLRAGTSSPFVALFINDCFINGQLNLDFQAGVTANNTTFEFPVIVGGTSNATLVAEHSTFVGGITSLLAANLLDISYSNVTFINPTTLFGTITANYAEISGTDTVLHNPLTANNVSITDTDVLTIIGPNDATFSQLNHSTILAPQLVLQNNFRMNNSVFEIGLIQATVSTGTSTGTVQLNDSTVTYTQSVLGSNHLDIRCQYFESMNSKYIAPQLSITSADFLNVATGTANFNGSRFSLTGTITAGSFFNIATGAVMLGQESAIDVLSVSPSLINNAGKLDISNSVVSAPILTAEFAVNSITVSTGGVLVAPNTEFSFPVSGGDVIFVDGGAKANLLGYRTTLGSATNNLLNVGLGHVDRDIIYQNQNVTWQATGPTGSSGFISINPPLNDTSYNILLTPVISSTGTAILNTAVLSTSQATNQFQLINQGGFVNGVATGTQVSGTYVYNIFLNKLVSTIN